MINENRYIYVYPVHIFFIYLIFNSKKKTMSTEPFIGETKILGFNFAPREYMPYQGQILSIEQNTALFSLQLESNF